MKRLLPTFLITFAGAPLYAEEPPPPPPPVVQELPAEAPTPAERPWRRPRHRVHVDVQVGANPRPHAMPAPAPMPALPPMAPMAPLPPMAPMAPRPPKAPKAPHPSGNHCEAPEAPEVPEVPEVPEAPEAPEAPDFDGKGFGFDREQFMREHQERMREHRERMREHQERLREHQERLRERLREIERGFEHAAPRDDDDDDDDDGERRLTATLAVSGPILLRFDTLSAGVTVVPGAPGRVTLVVEETDAHAARLSLRGPGRVEADFDGRPRLRSGEARIEVPPQSQLEIGTLSGDLVIRGVGGPVRARSVSGDILIDRAAAVEARSVSGDIQVAQVTGDVRVRTVSGDAKIVSASAAPRVEFLTTSGDFAFAGVCGPSCRIDARSTSGDMQLSLDPASSFDLRYVSHTGELSDELGMARGERPPREGATGEAARARHGRGDGSIDVETFSGDLRVRRR